MKWVLIGLIILYLITDLDVKSRCGGIIEYRIGHICTHIASKLCLFPKALLALVIQSPPRAG